MSSKKKKYASTPNNNYKSKPITKDEFKKMTENYREMAIMLIPKSAHVRYKSAVRDPETQEVTRDKNDRANITFKRGGFLISKHLEIKNHTLTGYVSLSNKPPNDRSGPKFNWNVQIDKYTKFYRILNNKERQERQKKKMSKIEEENEKLKERVSYLENKIKKLKKVTPH